MSRRAFATLSKFIFTGLVISNTGFGATSTSVESCRPPAAVAFERAKSRCGDDTQFCIPAILMTAVLVAEGKAISPPVVKEMGSRLGAFRTIDFTALNLGVHAYLVESGYVDRLNGAQQ